MMSVVASGGNDDEKVLMGLADESKGSFGVLQFCSIHFCCQTMKRSSLTFFLLLSFCLVNYTRSTGIRKQHTFVSSMALFQTKRD